MTEKNLTGRAGQPGPSHQLNLFDTESGAGFFAVRFLDVGVVVAKHAFEGLQFFGSQIGNFAAVFFDEFPFLLFAVHNILVAQLADFGGFFLEEFFGVLVKAVPGFFVEDEGKSTVAVIPGRDVLLHFVKICWR